jgi:hypothetical protein
VADVNQLNSEIAAGTHNPYFDLTEDNKVDRDDRTVWVEDLKNTYFGDVDLNGRVDSSDLNTLALNWRAVDATSWGQGDFNGDSNVNAADLNHLAISWQSGVSAAAAVPEPPSIALLLLSGFALWPIAHKRRRKAPRRHHHVFQ